MGFVFCLLLGWAHAQIPGLGFLGGPLAGKTTISYSGLMADPAFLGVTGNKVALHQQSAKINVPFYKTETDTYSAYANWGRIDLRPDDGVRGDLEDAEFGLSFGQKLEEDKSWGMSASYGSASDKPFTSNDVSTATATAYFINPNDALSKWILLMNYSNNRPFLNGIPLPGFAYLYTPSKEFTGIFGLPFAWMKWTFAENWNLTLMNMALYVAKAELAYSIMGPFQVYGGVDFAQKTYLIAGRDNLKERLYFAEKKAFVGGKAPVAKFLMLDFEVGHVFDRKFFLAEEYSVEPKNPVNWQNAPYAKLSLLSFF